MKILVTTKSKVETQDGRVYWTLEDSTGAKFQVWKEDLAAKISEGQTYDFFTGESKDGNRVYINGIKDPNKTFGSNGYTKKPFTPYSRTTPEERASIESQVCLVQACAATNELMKTGKILNYAQWLESVQMLAPKLFAIVQELKACK